ncbi:hypothetical protein BC937DRAFT_86363 [Endogone sp. FLAS-F59071]|nr:hypothetical protein BC937DRAFT_86363 [Endogone sp. FLAS-F59071]|eukprot:RUS13090.1 hypothetical protein BC937DRAFT_86363 [Endogone sp. FLAS-F59071]
MPSLRLFLILPSRSPITPRHRRGDIHSSQPLTNQVESGVGAAPQSSTPYEQNDDPAEITRVIWGTTINIQEVMTVFKQFIMGFKLQHRKRDTGEDITDIDREPFYPKLLNQIKEAEEYNMNLDCRNLLAYKLTQKLYHQLVRYPQEIIPLMDLTLTEAFLDIFEDVDLNGKSLKLPYLNMSDLAS